MAVSILATPAVATTTGPMKAPELKTLCTSDQDAERAICRGYLQGFLDGASAADPRLAERAIEEASAFSEWVRRAFETRVGTHVEQFATSISQDFCVGEADAVQAIKDRMLLTAQPPAADSAAGVWLYEFVQTNFPCQPVTS